MTEKQTEAKTNDMKTTFSPRIRYNWGYHDAAQTVQNHWDTPEHFFGFARALGEKMQTPADILKVHFDSAYADGWIDGYRDQKAGSYTGNSDRAWLDRQAGLARVKAAEQEAECQGGGRGWMKAADYRAMQARREFNQQFNEADCGGVFDGNTVTSDADPGL